MITLKEKLNYVWKNSNWRLLILPFVLIAIYFLQGGIPDFRQKAAFDPGSVFAALISFGIAIVGLLSFSFLLNILIHTFKLKIDFHPDDYNVSSGITHALETRGLRLPFAVSGCIINPLGEELLFRMLILGYLSGFLDSMRYGGAWASVISITAYCLLARKTKEVMEVLIIAAVGALCSYLYLRYSIWYSFAANGGFVVGIYATTAVFYQLYNKKDSAA